MEKEDAMAQDGESMKRGIGTTGMGWSEVMGVAPEERVGTR